MDGQYLIKFCIYYIIDKIYVIENGHFCKFATELQPLIYVRNCFLLNTLRMDGQNLTKFCIHIAIDKVWVGIVFFFFIFATELQPLIYNEIGVCSIS